MFELCLSIVHLESYVYSHLHWMNAYVTDQQYASFAKVSSNMLQNSIRYNKTDYIGALSPKLLATANFETIAHYVYDLESFFLLVMTLKDVYNSCSNICLQEEAATQFTFMIEVSYKLTTF